MSTVITEMLSAQASYSSIIRTSQFNVAMNIASTERSNWHMAVTPNATNRTSWRYKIYITKTVQRARLPGSEASQAAPVATSVVDPIRQRGFYPRLGPTTGWRRKTGSGNSGEGRKGLLADRRKEVLLAYPGAIVADDHVPAVHPRLLSSPSPPSFPGLPSYGRKEREEEERRLRPGRTHSRGSDRVTLTVGSAADGSE